MRRDHGHPKLEAGQDYHHIWWEKSSYRKRHERAFRNHVGLVLPVDIPVHQFLHHVIEPPEKPTREEMDECLRFINDRDAWAHEDNPYWAVEASMQYFVYRGADHPELEERCHDIRYNLARQIGVLAGHHTDEHPVIHIPRNNVVELRPREAA